MPAYQNITVEEKGSVLVLALNNPESRNPLTEETKTELLSALDYVKETAALRAVIITGRGPAFCAGGDIKKIGQELTPPEIREMMLKSQQLLKKLVGLEMPVIAAVNGDAFGMGCNLALAADFVVASEKARFCEVFVNIGLVLDAGGTYFLPRLVGLARARELALLGEMVDAKRAAEIGLIYKSVPDKDLDRETENLAHQLAQKSSLAMALIKEGLEMSLDMDLDEVLEWEAAHQSIMLQTEEHQEAVRRFKARRKK